MVVRTKLKEGDWVRVEGWVMLKGLDAGEYEVLKVFEENGKTVYRFRPKYSSSMERWVQHYAYDVRKWMENSSDINRIVKL